VRVENNEALLQISATNPTADAWTAVGKATVRLVDKNGIRLKAELVADAMAEAILSRLVEAQLEKGPKVNGKPTYRLRIRNASPLVLHGVALLGTGSNDKESRPSGLAGFTIPPRKGHTVPASAELVDRLNLKGGVRVVAADLSGL
jgi:hypothetical protein